MTQQYNDIDNPAEDPALKLKTARTLKWNLFDRLGSQVLYAITGIVLARVLSQDEFGLVGAVLVFQAFASLLVDSGFSSALIQRKAPSRLDYSTVLWFNVGVAAVLYVMLYVTAPLIAMIFQNDVRLVSLSRVMFLSLIINAAAIVQQNRFVKQMNVRPVAIANSIALTVAGIVGIWMAVAGYGAWAIVWQTLVMAMVRTALLWLMSRWLPMMSFSWRALRSFFSVGSGMLLTSFLNTVFLNIYSFFIGNRVGLTALGYYSQSDKWSKMFTASLSQVLTSSFLPVLSGVQDDAPRFANMSLKMNRMTAYITMPAMIGLCVMATPIFHLLFGEKWDASIILFQLLLVRGVFTVLTGLYTNCLLALGRSRLIVWMEVVRDSVALIALTVTFPVLALSTPGNPVYGVELMLWGQLMASVVAWTVTLVTVHRAAGVNAFKLIAGVIPYLCQSLLIAATVYIIGTHITSPLWSLLVQGTIALLAYLGINHLLHSRIQADAIAYLRGKL